jgi:hypothetical protein
MQTGLFRQLQDVNSKYLLSNISRRIYFLLIIVKPLVWFKFMSCTEGENGMDSYLGDLSGYTNTLNCTVHRYIQTFMFLQKLYGLKKTFTWLQCKAQHDMFTWPQSKTKYGIFESTINWIVGQFGRCVIQQINELELSSSVSIFTDWAAG